MRRFILVLMLLFPLLFSFGSLHAAVGLGSEPLSIHPVHLAGVAPRDYFVRVYLQGPQDAGFVYRATPPMNSDFSWSLDTTLNGEGTWKVRIGAVSPTGEWLGYLEQYSLTTSANTAITTVELQQGVNGYEGTTDCYISDWETGDTTTAFGAAEPQTIRLRKVDRKEGLFRFELQGVPANAQVQHAILGIYAFFNSNSSGPTYFAYQMLRPWSEEQATWLSPRQGETWAEPGAMQEGTDRKAAYLDKVCRPVTDPNDTCGVIIPGWHQFDITAAVQAWANGEPNYGVLIRSWDPYWNSRAENSFYSSEWQQIAMRPRLIIYYTEGRSTPTATSTATATATATPAATRTPMPPGPGTLSGSVRYQGRGAAPSAAWESPLIVTAHLPGDPTPAYTFNVASDQNGAFVVPSGILTGTYDVGVRDRHSLRNIRQNVAIGADTAPLDMGVLREGDANLDNWVNSLDFSILNSHYWTQQGDTGYDARADFNDDNWINALDFSLLNANYWQEGDALSPRGQTPTRQKGDDGDIMQAAGNVAIHAIPSVKVVANQEIFTLEIYLDAGPNPVDSVDCILFYNPAYLQGRAITPGDALPQPLGSNYIADGVSEYHHSVHTGTDPVTGSFKLFTLEFQAQAPTSVTNLTFGHVFAAGAGYGHAVAKRDGAITIRTETATPGPSPTPAPLGRIEGLVFLDTVENDTLDPDEPGIGKANVHLLSQSNALLSECQTDSSGHYAFENLPAGSYRVHVSSLPMGYALVDPSPRMVSLQSGGTGTAHLGVRGIYMLNLPLLLRGGRS